VQTALIQRGRLAVKGLWPEMGCATSTQSIRAREDYGELVLVEIHHIGLTGALADHVPTVLALDQGQARQGTGGILPTKCEMNFFAIMDGPDLDRRFPGAGEIGSLLCPDLDGRGTAPDGIVENTVDDRTRRRLSHH
jgi:hypothetical protein